jgi:hypothetical protein
MVRIESSLISTRTTAILLVLFGMAFGTFLISTLGAHRGDIPSTPQNAQVTTHHPALVS